LYDNFFLLLESQKGLRNVLSFSKEALINQEHSCSGKSKASYVGILIKNTSIIYLEAKKLEARW